MILHQTGQEKQNQGMMAERATPSTDTSPLLRLLSKCTLDDVRGIRSKKLSCQELNPGFPGLNCQCSDDLRLSALSLPSPLYCLVVKILSLIPRTCGPGNETRRPHSITKTFSQSCTYQAPANCISSWEYLLSSGSLGEGPFTTAFSCSKIVVHFPWEKVHRLISPFLHTELLQGCGLCACLMFLCSTHTCMYNVPAQGKVINPVTYQAI